MKNFFYIIPLIFIIASCSFKLEKLKAPDVVPQALGNKPNSDVNPADQIDFETVSTQVLQPKCLKCHNSGGKDPDLSTYESVAANLDDIRQDVSSGRMPKRDSLSDDQKKIILNWISIGAPQFKQSAPPVETAPAPTAPSTTPETPTVPTSPTTPDPSTGTPAPTNPTTPTTPSTPSPAPGQTHGPAGEEAPQPEVKLDYLTVNAKVISQSCFPCHQAPSNRGGVNLETYQGIMDNFDDVKQDIIDGSMPRKKTLTPDQKKLILDWLNAGAPETAP